MGNVRFYDNKVLFVDSKVAMHDDCCCPPDDCPTSNCLDNSPCENTTIPRYMKVTISGVTNCGESCGDGNGIYICEFLCCDPAVTPCGRWANIGEHWLIQLSFEAGVTQVWLILDEVACTRWQQNAYNCVCSGSAPVFVDCDVLEAFKGRCSTDVTFVACDALGNECTCDEFDT